MAKKATDEIYEVQKKALKEVAGQWAEYLKHQV